MNRRTSPFWYRRRDAMFGIVYGFGFWAGATISIAVRGAYVPGFVVCGGHWGTAGILGVLAAAVLATFAGFALRVWGSSYLSEGIVWSADARVDFLFVDGPFRYTRNPLYLGNLLQALGIGAVAPPEGWAILLIGILFLVYALIRWEETGLRERYGEQFARYCSEVPRLFPRLTPAPRIPAKPSLGAGLRAEVFSGSLVLGMLAIALLGMRGITVFYALFILGIIGQILSTRKARARLNAQP